MQHQIFWEIHNAGLINQLMSVEIGSSISFLEKVDINFFNVKHKDYDGIYIPWSNTVRVKEFKKKYKPNIFEIINMPKDINFKIVEDFFNDNYEKHENIVSKYYKCNDGDYENNFSEGRKKIILNKNKSNVFKKNCFSFYSRFFYNRTKDLDIFLNKIKFKDQYVDLAKKISLSFKNFCSIHFRLTDHAHNYKSNQEERMSFIKKIESFEKKIILSTDDKDLLSKEFGNKYLFVDDIILNDFKNDFLNLDFHDDVILGLISLLVLSHSDYFIGTPGSTFSSYIHRLRFLNNKENCFLFMNSRFNENFIQDGPFSWNGFKCDTLTKNWWREWPECKLMI